VAQIGKETAWPGLASWDLWACAKEKVATVWNLTEHVGDTSLSHNRGANGLIIGTRAAVCRGFALEIITMLPNLLHIINPFFPTSHSPITAIESS
jgi:hypothetical protein